MNIDKIYNRYLCPDCSQHNYIYKLLTNGLCLTCEKKVCICDKLIKADWNLPLPSSPLMPSSPSDFDCILLPKAISAPVTKTYAIVVSTPVNEQVEKIKKVYDEKMANLDKQLVRRLNNINWRKNR
jgi:hypothetical protein